MLDAHRAEIEAWLGARPEMKAVAVPARLRHRHPHRLADIHLRTTQRAVKVWQERQATQVVRAGQRRSGP